MSLGGGNGSVQPGSTSPGAKPSVVAAPSVPSPAALLPSSRFLNRGAVFEQDAGAVCVDPLADELLDAV